MNQILTHQQTQHRNTFEMEPASWCILFFAMLLIRVAPVQAQTLPAGFNQVLVASGITYPTTLEFSPDGRIFVAEQNGALRVIKNGSLLPTPFVSLSVDGNGERGLLGIAFDPNFENNQFIYLYYTLASGANNRISRFTANGDVAVAGSEVVVLDLDPLSGATNHNGGSIHFGIDGKLYVGVGENANGANAQNLDTYLGKILRINSDGSVPAGNPFTTGSNQRKRVWAYGMRNPWTFSVQPVTGRIFVNDVGENTWEEINDCTTGGLNFGWPNAEGMSTNTAYTNPVYTYQHGSGSGLGCSINGGTFFNPASTTYPVGLIGKYFFLDYCGFWIDKLTLNGSNATRSTFGSSIAGYPVGMAIGTDGNIYFLSRTTNSIYKITYTGNGAVSTKLFPVADAYVRGGINSNTNYGTAGKLITKNSTTANANYQTYIKFNISTFSAGIASAKLRLFGALGSTANSSVSVEVYNSNNNSWVENTITWNNKPAFENIVLASQNVIGTTKKYYEWDVTQLITGLRNAGINYVTLRVVNSGNSSSNANFNSKESSGYKPQLVVIHASSRLSQNDDQTVSAINTEGINFTVFPNPANDNISVTVENCSGKSDLKIYDITGKLALEINIYGSGSQNIFTGDLKPGMYIIRVENQFGILTKKLIIENRF